jgi:hypothetical protein
MDISNVMPLCIKKGSIGLFSIIYLQIDAFVNKS